MKDLKSTLRQHGAPVVSAFACLLLASAASFGFSGAAHATDGEPCPGMPTVTDADGNTYPTVRIGSQCWMREDLRTTKFRNGDAVPTASTNGKWAEGWRGPSVGPLRAKIDHASGSLQLYNFRAVRDARGICPAGWSVPTIAIWRDLIAGVGGSSVAGGKLKSTVIRTPTTHGWNDPNVGATNTSGFSGLPAGRRGINGAYHQEDLTFSAHWWSRSLFGNGAYGRVVLARRDVASTLEYNGHPGYGLSVRCVRDDPVVDLPTSTSCPSQPTVQDASGNVYDTVQVGSQCWMKQNLRTGQYRNGEAITSLASTSLEYVGGAADLKAWLRIENQNWNENQLGRLYTHGAVSDARGICPAGWHVPSDTEWNTMVSFLDPGANPNAPVEPGGVQTVSTSAGGALKSISTSADPANPDLNVWQTPNAGATDASAFRALPAGLVTPQMLMGRGTGAVWWTSTTTAAGDKAWYRSLSHLNTFVYRRSDLRKFGLAVRCVKD